jgi:hypothetical protein
VQGSPARHVESHERNVLASGCEIAECWASACESRKTRYSHRAEADKSMREKIPARQQRVFEISKVLGDFMFHLILI